MHKKRLFLIITVFILALTVGTIAWALLANSNTESLKDTATHANQPPATPVKSALTCVAALPDSIKIGQKIMAAGFSGQLSDQQATFIQSNIGGVIIMDETSATSLQSFRTGFSIAPTIATDQEGGTVQRYTSEGILPGASDMATSYSADQA